MMIHFAVGFLVSMAVVFPTQATVKDGTVKPIAKLARNVSKTPTITPVHEVPIPVILSAEQLAMAQKVLLGTSRCELGVDVTMRVDAHTPGRFILDSGRKRYMLDPVVTSTGAVRLEEAKSGTVWLQLANKSMLMDQRLGQRIADECMNPQQLLVAQALLVAPAPHLLDSPKDALVPVMAGKLPQEMVPNTVE